MSYPVESAGGFQAGQSGESLASSARRSMGDANVYYQCGQTSHYKMDYPHLMREERPEQGAITQSVDQFKARNDVEGTSRAKQKGSIGRPRQQGKMYAMTQ